MGYLVCEKCNGYYELQSGESPEDFKSCQCGGSLRYVESLDNGRIAGLRGIIIGVIVTVLFLLFAEVTYLLVFGGLITAYITSDRYKEGIKSGFFTGGISTVIIMVVGILFDLHGLKSAFMEYLTGWGAVILLLVWILAFTLGGILGSVGGLIGVYLKKSRINIKDLNKVNWKAIIAGTGISTIASIIIGSPILLLTGGYAAAYIASGSYKNGIKYVFLRVASVQLYH